MGCSVDNNTYSMNIAVLESRIDHLETELSYLDNLLIQCGFSEGISTLKLTAEELIKENLYNDQKHTASSD